MFDISTIDERKVQDLINDLALRTATNASDWNYRFVNAEDRRNPKHRDAVVFSHPAGMHFHAFVEVITRTFEAADVQVTDQGSVVLFRPLTDAGLRFIKQRLWGQSFTGEHGVLVVESRYAADLAAGMREAGLKLDISG